MKDNMLAYEYRPDQMQELVPSPRYIEKALNKNAHHLRDAKYNLERYRTSGILRRQNEHRYAQGRYYTHLKLDQIKRGVKDIRDKIRDEELKAAGVKQEK